MKRFCRREERGPASRITWVAAWGLTSFLCAACNQAGGGGGTSPGFSGGGGGTSANQNQATLQAQVKELKQKNKNLEDKLKKQEDSLSECGELTEKGELDCQKISGCKWTGTACELNQTDKCKIEDPTTCNGTAGCAYSFKVGCHDAGTCRFRRLEELQIACAATAPCNSLQVAGMSVCHLALGPGHTCVQVYEDLCEVVNIKNDDTVPYEDGCKGLLVDRVTSAVGDFDVEQIAGGGFTTINIDTALCTWTAGVGGGAGSCDRKYKDICSAHFVTHYAGVNPRTMCEQLKAESAEADEAFIASLFSTICRYFPYSSTACVPDPDVSASLGSKFVNQAMCEAGDNAKVLEWVPKP